MQIAKLVRSRSIALAAALSGLVLSNFVYGKTCTQEVRDHRTGKTITRQVDCTTRKPVTRPSNKPTTSGSEPAKSTSTKTTVIKAQPKKSDSHLKLIMLDNRSSLPNRIPKKGVDKGRGVYKTTAVIIADELDLGSRVYSALSGSSPRNVIIVANKLTLNETIKFDLSGRNYDHKRQVGLDLNDRSGGDLLILANEFICQENGRFGLTSGGGTVGNSKVSTRDQRTRASTTTNQPRNNALGRTVQSAKVPKPRTQTSNNALQNPRNMAGKKGRLMIAANQLKMGHNLVEETDLWEEKCLIPSARKGTYFYPSMKEAVSVIEQDDAAPHGWSPRAWAGHLPITLWARHATSKWMLKMLDDAILDMGVLTLSNNRIDAVKQLRKVTALMSEKPPMLNSDKSFLQERIDKLLPLRSQYADVAWFEETSLDMPGSIPRQIMLFTDGDDLLTRIAPTDILIRPRLFSNQTMLGQIKFDDEDADRIHIEFEFALSLDPMVESLVLADLAKNGEQFAGVFNDWTLSPRHIQMDGVIDSKIDLQADNRGGRVAFTIDANSLGLFLTRLSSRTGIPVVFDWHFRDSPGKGGVWSGAALSLLRRSSSPLIVNPGGTVTNNGSVDLAIEYVNTADGNFRSFASSKIVPNGQTISLPEFADTSFSIPPEAISYVGMDPYKVRSKFQIVNGGEWVDKVTVTNLLGFDENRGGQLRYVEFKLHYKTLHGELVSAVTKLSPTGGQGDEATVSFLHEPLTDRQITLTGTAFYEGGSIQTLTEKTFTDLSIKISSDLLPSMD